MRVTAPLSRVWKDLLELGAEPGSVLLVHTAFSRISPIEGGPEGLIAALEGVLGPQGTLVMPSLSDDDETPFDPKVTPCRGMGVVADLFWRQAGVLRSDNPHAFAARGPHAEAITRAHPVDVPHGSDSPPGRVLDLDGWVLLLGVGHDANTTLHVAENLAGVRYGKPSYATVSFQGRPQRHDYVEVDHCCAKFAQLDAWLDAKGAQRRGRVGYAEARLVRSRDVVETALERLRQDETVFLHAAGQCAECDEARKAIPS